MQKEKCKQLFKSFFIGTAVLVLPLAVIVVSLVTFSLWRQDYNIKHHPMQSRNSIWVCQEMDANMIVDRWQHTLVVINHGQDQFIMDPAMEWYGLFHAYPAEELNIHTVETKGENWCMSGDIKYRKDRVIVTIEPSGNRLWEQEGTLTLTFVKQDQEYFADFSPESTVIPEELADVVFDSPEEALASVNSFGEVYQVLDGEESSLVIAENLRVPDSPTKLIAPKSGDGWKAATGAESFPIMIFDVSKSGTSQVYVYRYRDTGDYYIRVININGALKSISDNRGSEFYIFEEQTSRAPFFEPSVHYYTYVPDLDESYTLTVNGKTVNLLDH